MITVLGGSGFLGSHVIERLAMRYAVRGTYLNTPPACWPCGMQTMRVDLRQPDDAFEACVGSEAVVMCAAVTSGAGVIVSDPLAHVTDNVVMNAVVLAAARRAGVRKFIFVGSSAAYPRTGLRPTREDELFDGEPDPAYWWVGHLKRYAERLVWGYATKLGMSCISLRPSNLYGPRDKFDPKTSHMVAALMRKVADHQDPLEVWGTGNEVRDLLYVEDMAIAVEAAIEYDTPYGEYNIATGRGTTVRGVVDLLCELEGYKPEVVYKADKPTTIDLRLVDVSRAGQYLGWQAYTPLAQGLALTLEWWKKNKGWWRQ